MALKLSPGIYVLSQDVENPHPDRRYKHDWRCEPVFAANTKFVVGVNLHLRKCGAFAHHDLCLGQYDALLPHLRPGGEECSWLWLRESVQVHEWAEEVLLLAIDKGLLTEEQIVSLVAEAKEASQ